MKATALAALALAGCAVGLIVAGAGAQVPPGQTSPEYQQTTPTDTTPTTTPAPPDDTTGPTTQPGAEQQPRAGDQPSGRQAPAAVDRGTRTLPVTGLPARMIAAVGLLFVAAGIALRRVSAA
jgi:hypothetical protein